MTYAPDRIWLTTTNSGRVDNFTMWLDDQSHLPPEAPRTAYIRADLHDAQLAALRDRVEALQEALRPFSEEAGYWFERNYNASDMPVEGFSDYRGVMTCGDLFKARAVLKADQ